MFSTLKRIRGNLLMNNKTRSYFLYAIGEIILVMAGILLALYVNNVNERRKETNQLTRILKTVRADLVTDTIVATEIIKFYDTINKYSNKIINKEYNANTIESCMLCRSLITIYQPYTVQDKGYTMLKNFNELNFETSDSLEMTIIQFYKSTSTIIEQGNEFVKSKTLDNLDFIAQKNWFVDWMQGRLTEDMKLFFGESLEYKNLVAKNLILASSNHANFIKAHNRGAKELIERLDERLKE